MDITFWILLWVSIPSGGHSEFFGAPADCVSARTRVVAAKDTMYASECISAPLKMLRQVTAPGRKDQTGAPRVYPDPNP